MIQLLIEADLAVLVWFFMIVAWVLSTWIILILGDRPRHIRLIAKEKAEARRKRRREFIAKITSPFKSKNATEAGAGA